LTATISLVIIFAPEKEMKIENEEENPPPYHRI
jgi:hypothetical protein